MKRFLEVLTMVVTVIAFCEVLFDALHTICLMGVRIRDLIREPKSAVRGLLS